LHVDPQARHLGHHVPPRPLAVVGEESEGDVKRSQLSDEGVRTGDQLAAPVQDAVHVDEIAVLHGCLLLNMWPWSWMSRPGEATMGREYGCGDRQERNDDALGGASSVPTRRAPLLMERTVMVSAAYNKRDHRAGANFGCVCSGYGQIMLRPPFGVST